MAMITWVKKEERKKKEKRKEKRSKKKKKEEEKVRCISVNSKIIVILISCS